MAKIVAKINTTIKIPPYFKGLTGKEWVVVEFTANEPVEVSDKIADYYTKNRSKIFKYYLEEEVPFYKPEEIEEPPKEFNPEEFVEDNYDNIEAAIEAIEDRKQLIKICELIGLTKFEKLNIKRIKERIISDIKINKEHQTTISNLL